MLTMVKIINENLKWTNVSSGSSLELSLQDPSNGYQVREITGLDPVKAEISKTPFANLDGAKFQNARRETRNIVMTIGIDPENWIDKSISSLRNDLYYLLSPKSEVTLEFYQVGGPDVKILGYVETFESVLFSQNPQVQISILCMGPDFLSLSPFEMEIEMKTSSTTGNRYTPFIYEGTEPTGIEFTILPPEEDIEGLGSIFFEFTRGTLFINKAYSIENQTWTLEEGAQVLLDSREGSKQVIYIPPPPDPPISWIKDVSQYGAPSSIIWPTFFPGYNIFRVSLQQSNLPDGREFIPALLKFDVRYGGL